jgi:hypothetical protein
MMIVVDPAAADNVAQTRWNLPASLFFTLCFYTDYFFDADFYANKYFARPNWLMGKHA